MAWRFDDPYCDVPPPYRQTFNPGFASGYGGGWGRNPLKRIRKAKRFYEDLEKEWDTKKKNNTKPNTTSRLELWIIMIFFVVPIVGFTSLALGSWLLKLTYLNLKAIGAP